MEEAVSPRGVRAGGLGVDDEIVRVQVGGVEELEVVVARLAPRGEEAGDVV